VSDSHILVDIADKREEEFHEALMVAIPSLVQLLKRRDVNVQSAAISVIENLAEHGELQGNVTWMRTSLMLMCSWVSWGADGCSSIPRSTA
jgi:hypothetical protein